MTTDYKALCAALLQQLDWLLGGPVPEESNPGRVADRARAALAEGVGVGPTDEELIAFARSRSPWREWMESNGSLANAHFELAELLRAAISRYGTTHPRPIPVAEGAGVGVRDSDLPHLVRFLCQTWAEIDDWACRECGEAITSYPVIQGTANQLALRRIGVQPFDSSRLRPAVRLMDSAARAIAQSGTTHPRPIPVADPGAADSIVDDTGKPWHQTMSGALWAKAFVAMHGGDEDLMLGWFCNAGVRSSLSSLLVISVPLKFYNV